MMKVKKILSTVLGLALVLTMSVPAAAFAETAQEDIAPENALSEAVSGIIDQGSFSADSNISWSLSEDGTLLISGTGKLVNDLWKYTDNGCPWDKYKDDIKAIVIGDGITYVGKWTLSYLREVESIVISDTVTAIGEAAFCNCSKVKELKLGKNVRTIKGVAFSSMESLGEIVLPDSVRTIEEAAFSYCLSLKTVRASKELLNKIDILEVFPATPYVFKKSGEVVKTSNGMTYTLNSDGLLTIKGNVECRGFGSTNPIRYFRDNYIKTVRFENDITEISDAFWMFRKATDIEIPDTVTYIENAFILCESLEEITLPENLRYLGNSAFHNCYSLKTITIPENVAEVGYTAFEGCGSLTQISISDKTKIIETIYNDDAFAIGTRERSTFRINDEKEITPTYYEGKEIDTEKLAADKEAAARASGMYLKLNGSIIKSGKRKGQVKFTFGEKSQAALKKLEDMGYQLDIYYYKSADNKPYTYMSHKIKKYNSSMIPTKGVKGTTYYYSARIIVRDSDGNAVGGIRNIGEGHAKWTGATVK